MIGTKRSKGTEGLLKVAVAVCVLFTLVHLIEFSYSHLPPYREGTCLSLANNPIIALKVKENHLLGGYSDVEASLMGQIEVAPVPFSDLRSPAVESVECPK
jgi:hypothetical protein